jgi:hypothetical protein
MMPLLPIERRDAVREQYPWLLERDQAMVVGTDLDALISAAFMHHHFNWQPIGVYNLKEIYAADGASNDDLKRAIWVDLDIARSDIRSVGHHILTNRPGETISGLSGYLNPNLLRSISMRQFARKYPLSTLHLLMWLTNKDAPGKVSDEFAIWLPDSCWIIAQKYSRNVREWLTNWMPHPFLISTVDACNTRDYEEAMGEFLKEFRRNVPLPVGRGQIQSVNLGLHGYQCRYSDPRSEAGLVQQTLDYLADLMNFQPMHFPHEYRQIPGVRNRHVSDLADFIVREEIFSYVMPNSGIINFTSFDDF